MIMASSASYAFDVNGMVVAFDGNHVIAKGEDFEKVACTADEYFNSLRGEHQQQKKETARKAATHITTPNGEKGTILGHTEGLWSDEITVRFDNGQIRRFATFAGDNLKYSAEQADLPTSPIEYLQKRVDEIATPGREGLTARLQQLDEIRKEASTVASQAPYGDARALHQIVLTANAERNEIREALDHLIAADAEAFVPPKPMYSAVEQASVGPSNDWLEVVAREMVADSESEDLDKLLSEGPTLLVSSLETGALAEAGTVRELAVEHIHAKTAGFEGQEVEEYRNKFVANAETARRQEFAYRKDEARVEQAKVASSTEGAPDEALFL